MDPESGIISRTIREDVGLFRSDQNRRTRFPYRMYDDRKITYYRTGEDYKAIEY